MLVRCSPFPSPFLQTIVQHIQAKQTRNTGPFSDSPLSGHRRSWHNRRRTSEFLQSTRSPQSLSHSVSLQASIIQVVCKGEFQVFSKDNHQMLMNSATSDRKRRSY